MHATTRLRIPAAKMVAGRRGSGLLAICLFGPRARPGVVQKRYIQSTPQTDRDTIARLLYSISTKWELGTRARSITSGLFSDGCLDKDKYGLVGKITTIDDRPIEAATRASARPILTGLDASNEDQILKIDTDIAAGSLAKKFEMKMVFLNDKGRSVPCSSLILFIAGIQPSWKSPGSHIVELKLREFKEILGHLPRPSSVAVIGTDSLQKELFTDSDAGTSSAAGIQARPHHEYRKS
ncbi:hypothetical protein H1R20_g5889, partial [Candolleomyces eurysporus]